MAKATPGPIISNISGSIGGTNFRNDKSGLVIANKQQPTRKQSAGQLNHRAFFAQCATAWSNLDADIKKAWASLAATEQIPTPYSKGRRWTGRQLFTCFYIQAEHQYTPLPARWLPTPPIFWPDLYFCLSYFPVYYSEEEEEWMISAQVLGATPISLDPDPLVGYEYAGCFTLWAGFLPLGSERTPHAWRKICPMPSSYTVTNSWQGAPVPDPPAHFYSGYHYQLWYEPLLLTLGLPPGITNVEPTGPGQAPTVSLAAKAACVTDERIYYSGIHYGHAIVESRPSGLPYSDLLQLLPSGTITPDVRRDYDVLSIPTSSY